MGPGVEVVEDCGVHKRWELPCAHLACVSVCVCEQESVRERESVCARERMRVYVCECVCERERESECVSVWVWVCDRECLSLSFPLSLWNDVLAGAKTAAVPTANGTWMCGLGFRSLRSFTY